ncbi:MAG: hypothetical protein PHT78_10230 [Desulfitobacteriaceae bacterium]|nr:hypothetical protein [Desulfitobacteriaceae bacterium]
MKISLRGNKSIRAVFDSQVVRLDVIAPRVVGLDVGYIDFPGFTLKKIDTLKIRFIQIIGYNAN